MLFSACNQQVGRMDDFERILSRIPGCGLSESSNIAGFNIFRFASKMEGYANVQHPRFLPAGEKSGLPLVTPNDNRTPAGTMKEGVLELDLEVKWSDWRVESKDRPGLKVVAIAESGKAPSIPAPLIRVETGTLIRARVRNALKDSTITIFGFQERPSETADSLFLPPGDSGEITFKAGQQGTYLYWVQLGHGIKRFANPEDTEEDFGEEEQLAGAFIIDPKGGSEPDRIFVMNIFSTPIDTLIHPDGWLEGLTINGRSWPFTELIRPAVGETLNWRVVNASRRNHPMHLHGFYYDIIEDGNVLTNNIYPPDQYRKVVTETMTARKTMYMKWEVSRPGKWLFHCHLSFHVAPGVRLPDKLGDENHKHDEHMAGLVIGIEVPPGESDLISKGAPRNITLHANQSDQGSVSFDLEQKKTTNFFTPGPLLILKQYQPTFVTVDNHMSITTSLHWHGLEIDSWADGVPGWSASDGRTSPPIDPGKHFTYKLSLMRPGTFIYHSHLDDVHQLTSGLYGPMIVLGENESYDPGRDHPYIIGWKSQNLESIEDLDLNGWDEIPVQEARVGEAHKLRMMNIGPAGRMSIFIMKGEDEIPVKMVAKDGADLPDSQITEMKISPKFGVGETADFIFTPAAPGTYVLHIKYMKGGWEQTWVVKDE